MCYSKQMGLSLDLKRGKESELGMSGGSEFQRGGAERLRYHVA